MFLQLKEFSELCMADDQPDRSGRQDCKAGSGSNYRNTKDAQAAVATETGTPVHAQVINKSSGP